MKAGNNGTGSVLAWTTEDVRTWLTELGMARYIKLLCDQHKIDGPALVMIQEQDLKQPPIQLEVMGDIKKLVYHIGSLKYSLIYPDAQTKFCLNSGVGAPVRSTNCTEKSHPKWSNPPDISSSDEWNNMKIEN